MVIEMFNDKYQQIYQRRHLLGISLFKAVPELETSSFPEILKRVYETGEFFTLREGMARIYNAITEDFETIVEMADRITSSVARADRMIRDLLNANRIKADLGIPISVEECFLDQIVNYVVNELEDLHGKRFEIKN
jgi:signal transduction histidine kinase